MHIAITGANRGIGHALLTQYRAAGHSVTGTARADTSGTHVALDVTQPAQFSQLSQALTGQSVDLLICNAGVYLDKGQSLANGYPADMWAQEFATNVTGVFLTVQTLLPNLAPGSKIAIISSQMASHTRAPGGSYIYRASKAAALNLGRNLATDLKPKGICVGIYHPGWVQTDMGGPTAEITVDAAATGLIARFAALGPATTGCFETWDGHQHPY
ncbi:SDR family NAD(P)-dependent oxidoreductase [Thalassovita taeanensis]|uniref:NAD(P)-dependent dehydrogenase, short-chain alcohol dehydrogenase family n=1 Tax=Thalassovita taeanensis TaxID=657014 RepID=A0A1H9A7Y4_9RHOB|nr:SDR family NAD(P)-dependent oxidoreductase [Thalassovita taeanensis]SEP72759.1 NAD(P)-dependent dehydrogenase, short-chain alcohol dehydrogenase family [Thalassovita taeanensis]